MKTKTPVRKPSKKEAAPWHVSLAKMNTRQEFKPGETVQVRKGMTFQVMKKGQKPLTLEQVQAITKALAPKNIIKAVKQVYGPDTRSETAIQREILDNLLKLGVFAWRNSKGVVPIRDKKRRIVAVRKADEATNGMPDIFLVIRGRLIGIEVKSAKGTQDPDQVEWQRKMMKAGAIYVLARSWDDVMDDLSSFLER